MIHLSVRHDFAKVAAKIKEQARSQVPFALAKTLTDLAKEVQTEVKREIPKNFTVRRQWIVNGIRMRSATKRNLEAAVFSRDKFMNKQEFGGVKRAGETRVWRVGKKIAIPTPLAKGGSKSGIVPKKNWPENLVKSFRIKAKDGRECLAVRNKTKLMIMYVLEDQITMKDRLKMREVGQRVISKRFNKVFGANLGRALASQK